jgi:hypothetical protein
MLVFLDTEFTDFVRPELISLALVCEDGREFYAERTDYDPEQCSEFVHETVIPLLGRVPSAACTRTELIDRLQAWFKALPETAAVVFDFRATGIGWSPPRWVVHRKISLLISPHRFGWATTPSITRFLRRHKTTPTPKTGLRTMRWPMLGC